MGTNSITVQSMTPAIRFFLTLLERGSRARMVCRGGIPSGHIPTSISAVIIRDFTRAYLRLRKVGAANLVNSHRGESANLNYRFIIQRYPVRGAPYG